jgi:hypothetical protein
MPEKKSNGLRFIFVGFIVAISVAVLMCGVTIRQEIIRLRYQDPGVVAKTVAAIVGIGPNIVIPACRFKKGDDKLNIEAIDPAGGGGASSATEAERTAVNLSRASTAGTLQLQPAPGGVTGPPGGLGALPPFSALFGPQPPPPAVLDPEHGCGEVVTRL